MSVDDVPFGSSAQSLIADGYVEDIAGYDEITRWKCFKKDDDLEFYVKDDAVVCVCCFKNCHIDGVSMIGELSDDVIGKLGAPDEIGEAVWVSDEQQQIPYEYFSLGLQVWIESGRVVSVFCNDVY